MFTIAAKDYQIDGMGKRLGLDVTTRSRGRYVSALGGFAALSDSGTPVVYPSGRVIDYSWGPFEVIDYGDSVAWAIEFISQNQYAIHKLTYSTGNDTTIVTVTLGIGASSFVNNAHSIVIDPHNTGKGCAVVVHHSHQFIGSSPGKVYSAISRVVFDLSTDAIDLNSTLANNNANDDEYSMRFLGIPIDGVSSIAWTDQPRTLQPPYGTHYWSKIDLTAGSVTTVSNRATSSSGWTSFPGGYVRDDAGAATTFYNNIGTISWDVSALFSILFNVLPLDTSTYPKEVMVIGASSGTPKRVRMTIDDDGTYTVLETVTEVDDTAAYSRPFDDAGEIIYPILPNYDHIGVS